MKFLFALTLALGFSSSVVGQDHRHPNDPCPKGQREVTRETTTTTKGGADVRAGTGQFGGGVNGGHERTTKETEKVCRDVNK